jgi:molybdenum cofactor guanylyltransferase
MTIKGGWAGAVLCGGESRRMGRNKSDIRVGGRAMVDRAVAALVGAGCRHVCTVGGAPLAEVTYVPDRWPGEGPLGGIITALHHFSGEAEGVVVLATDLPRVTSSTVSAIVSSLGDFDLAVASDPDGALQPLCALWRVRLLTYLDTAFANGLRTVHGAVGHVDAVAVPLSAEELTNVNTPEDLGRLG